MTWLGNLLVQLIKKIKEGEEEEKESSNLQCLSSLMPAMYVSTA